MRDFRCPNCGQQLAFENSKCLKCGNELAFDLSAREFAIVDDAGFRKDVEGIPDLLPGRHTCGNRVLAACNWLTADATSTLCPSCRLTRTRPADTDSDALGAFAAAETAKRRLVLELTELGLPLDGRDVHPDTGLAFDLLSSAAEGVTTGHADGLITLDLAESDDVHREQLRVSMDEPYRTLLGHFRHEIGHYYFTVLVTDDADREEFEDLFGDPDLDYQQAIDRHYSQGAPARWEAKYVSSYATMHPAEDWAESFAHYLHIRDTIDTAAAFSVAPAGTNLDRPLPGRVGFDRIIEVWLPLSWALNMINRSMGHPDLYPFVLPPPVMDKLHFVHRLVVG